MSRIAFVFPGQGAQYFGMGKDFYENNSASRAVYDKAGEITGLDIKKLCFEENDKLNITEYTQIALLTTELAMLKAVTQKGLVPEVTAGLSLGEYAALVAAGKLSEEDAMKVVRQRGIFMQEAVPTGGAMAAVLGLDFAKVEEICAGTNGIVELANYNCPGQIVISGEEAAVLAASEALKAAGAKRVAALNVSGPFHSSMLKGAGEKLAGPLSEADFKDSSIPYVANTTAQYVSDKNEIKQLLVRQVSSSVRWEQSVRLMLENGIDTFIEIGPGKTLAGFLKRIDRKAVCMNIGTVEVALVTGASRGIGREIALTLAKNGAKVIVNYNGSEASAKAVVAEIEAFGGSAAAYQCNVADFEASKAMIDAIIKENKRLDILVNNAGITKDGLMMRMSEADFDDVININLKGSFNCIRHVSRQMLKQRGGRIINMSSFVGRSGNAGQLNYAASKAGVIGLTMSAARELASRGVTVNAVAPGFIQTEMTDVLSEDAKNTIMQSIPMGVLGQTEDVAQLVLFLASDAAKYITGQTISVDGGMYMG